MHRVISQEEYKKEIINFLNLKIDKIRVFFEPNLLVGGFSLIHVLNEGEKLGKILGLAGIISYKKNDIFLSANTKFEDEKDGKIFEQAANKIKKQLLENSVKISKIDFDDECKNVKINFNDGSELSVSLNSETERPLTYDNHLSGYAIYFGEQTSGDKSFNYFKVVFE